MSAPIRRSPTRRPLGARPTRRQIIVRRVAAIAVLLIVGSVSAGLVLSGTGSSVQATSIADYARAWADGDYRAMYAELTPESRERYSFDRFERSVARARRLATVRRIEVTDVQAVDETTWRIASRVHTRVFGVIERPLEIPVTGAGSDTQVLWDDHLVFPGMSAGDTLARRTRMPARADILARDGTRLAAGSTRYSGAPDVAGQVAGSLGPIPAARRSYYSSRGYPTDARIGVNGLERIFESRLAGTPGGTLRSGTEVLARTTPRPARNVETAVDIGIERAAVRALAGRVGAVVAIRPQTGEVVGFAGIPFSGLQPPGSTFKIITLAGALQAGIASPSDTFPSVQTTEIGGVPFDNADREYCGGTLVQAFARSCNTVFGPLGARLGAERMLTLARRFGFDARAAFPGVARSTMPSREQLDDDVKLAAAAIGQNTVNATALQMGIVAATIGLGGRRPELTLLQQPRTASARTSRVISPAVARQVEDMMLAGVTGGTGINAAIPGVRVAGKTGTAELRDTQVCDPTKPPLPTQTTTTPTTTTQSQATQAQTTTTPEDPRDRPCPEATPEDTTAWFTAYAPAGNPRIAVCVYIVGGGQGRDTAAPAARQVIEAAL